MHAQNTSHARGSVIIVNKLEIMETGESVECKQFNFCRSMNDRGSQRRNLVIGGGAYLYCFRGR